MCGNLLKLLTNLLSYVELSNANVTVNHKCPKNVV